MVKVHAVFFPRRFWTSRKLRLSPRQLHSVQVCPIAHIAHGCVATMTDTGDILVGAFGGWWPLTVTTRSRPADLTGISTAASDQNEVEAIKAQAIQAKIKRDCN
jgi:hypothetical protein